MCMRLVYYDYDHHDRGVIIYLFLRVESRNHAIVILVVVVVALVIRGVYPRMSLPLHMATHRVNTQPEHVAIEA